MNSITHEHIQIEKIEYSLIVRFDRPNKKNAFTISMYETLNEIMETASLDETVKVLVFSSTSDSFSAGNDLLDFKNNPPIESNAPVYEFVRHLAKFEKPMIAAVDGLAVGLGFTMLLHCDFVFTTRQAKLMAPFVNLALVPEAGSTRLLNDLVGPRKTAEILMLGNMVPGEKAVELGIANELVEPENLERKALEVARTLCFKPKDALFLTKELLKKRDELIVTVNKEIEYFRAQVISEDCREGINAVLEKRTPNFK